MLDEFTKGIIGYIDKEEDKKLTLDIIDQEDRPKITDNDAEILIKTILDETNKKTFARTFLESVPLYFDRNNIWWYWNRLESCWEIVDEIDILNIIRKVSRMNTIRPHEKSELMNAIKQESRDKKPKDIKTKWIQFKDYIIDLETGDRFRATSEYFATNPIPYKLGRSDETPVMDKIFEEWVGKDYVKTLYEIIAYCLIPDYPIHRIFCFIGSGMNGKSCFLNLLRKFIGNKNVCSTELDTLLKSRFEVTKLHKKLVCQMGETNFNEISKTSILKKLSGGDLIGFEYKNKNPFEEINYAKILISTNNLPTTTDKTVGFYRRWMIVDFPNQFNEKKDILLDIPDEEYNNLACKCIGLLMDLIDKREFTNEGSIEERKRLYESKSNFLKSFIDEFIDEDSNENMTKADFNRRFKEWCKENKHREMADQSINRDMKKLGYESNRQYFNWLFDGKGGQLWVWRGIKWKN